MVNPCVGWLPMVFNPPAKLCSKQESLTGLQLGGGGVGRRYKNKTERAYRVIGDNCEKMLMLASRHPKIFRNPTLTF